jgi:hypothetical protein
MQFLPVRATEYKQFRGGGFLICRLKPNRYGSYSIQHYDLSDPHQADRILAVIGRTKHGKLVYALDGKKYTRVSTAEMRGLQWQELYRQSPRAANIPWGSGKGKFALLPFRGKFEQFEPL